MQPIFIATLAISLAASIALVPMVRAIAVWIGLVDKPDAQRKLHSRPISLGGGVAVFASMMIAFGGVVILDRSAYGTGLLPHLTLRWYSLFIASGAMLLLGLVDDKWPLRGRQKLLMQCLIAMSLVGSGTVIEQVSFFDYHLPLGAFAIPVTVLWLLVATNALNLLDGADGMATTVGIFACGGLALLTVHNQENYLGFVVSVALSGALIGFLWFNRPPASIFLGDAGSMMIGLTVGVLAIWCSVKGSTTVAVGGPIAILVLPLFDSTAAIIRRWMTGRSMYATDRGHLHHLLHHKFGPQGMLAVVAGLCTFSSLMAYISVRFNQSWTAFVGAICVLFLLVVTRSFGHSEFRLLGGRMWHFVLSFFLRPGDCDQVSQQRRVQIQGQGSWDTVWEPLVDFAKKYELSRVKIDVHLSWLHEGYHATWQSVRLPDKEFQSVVRIPLFVNRNGGSEVTPIGRVEIISGRKANSNENLGEFLVHAGELQDQVQRLVEFLEARSRSPQLNEANVTDEGTLPARVSSGLDRMPVTSDRASDVAEAQPSLP